jgi:hypothetical protein
MATGADTHSRLLIVTGAAAADVAELPVLVRSLISSASEILVVAPVLPGRLEWLVSDTDRVRQEADERLQVVVGHVETLAPDASESGTVGDETPLSAFADAVRGLREIDDWYLRTVDQLYAELEGAAPPESSEPIARHRHEVAELLRDAAVVTIAGGHVGILLRCLRLFAVAPPRELPVVAWSAGAMALTERVVLYNDRGPQGVQGAEVWDRGIGRVPNVVAMPHARRRLRLDDSIHAKVLVQRFAPATCLLLDDGTQVEIGADGSVPEDARVLTETGAATS